MCWLGEKEGSLGRCPNLVILVSGRLVTLSPADVLLDFRKGEIRGSWELLQAEDPEPNDDVDASSEGKGRKLKKKACLNNSPLEEKSVDVQQIVFLEGEPSGESLFPLLLALFQVISSISTIQEEN